MTDKPLEYSINDVLVRQPDWSTETKDQTARTQYAGTGLQVNIEGSPESFEDAIREIVRDELDKQDRAKTISRAWDAAASSSRLQGKQREDVLRAGIDAYMHEIFERKRILEAQETLDAAIRNRRLLVQALAKHMHEAHAYDLPALGAFDGDASDPEAFKADDEHFQQRIDRR